jgi:hypothetical protein
LPNLCDARGFDIESRHIRTELLLGENRVHGFWSGPIDWS